VGDVAAVELLAHVGHLDGLDETRAGARSIVLPRRSSAFGDGVLNCALAFGERRGVIEA
jgi:hypothetical protein